MPSLAEVQQQMRDAVVKGDANGMGALVAGGGDAGRRLAIHQRHYRASLVAALMGRFKATAWLMGSEAVERAAATFVREQPPVVPCLAEYGEAFPQYLSRHVTTNRVPYLELTFSTLLVVGLATRVATLPFLAMILVIQTFVYPQAWVEHLTWASILVFLLTRGPGAISLDHLIWRRLSPGSVGTNHQEQ